ncbi:MAG: efflux RND transporter periplasmic adaptor subunit [Desulfocapsaceae bacterium]|nr:efflux RND transporter periplasmic adaptor subunit [Desulfocapsaceae bacterium]
MRKLIRWLIFLVVIGGIAFFIWLKARPQPVEVVVRAVEKGIVEQTVANTRAGTVDACRRAKLSPSIGGQIAKLPIDEGDQVKAGELLLEIWNEDLSAQLALAERELQVATAQADAACFNADEAQRQAERSRKLFASKSTSEELYDRAVTQAKSSLANCEAAKSSIQTSTARIEVARANLSRTRLLAPFAGVIAKINGELNEYVTPSPVGVQIPPTIDLIENDCYYVTAPIDEVDAAGVRVGMEARIHLDAFKNKTFAGEVRRISPYVLDLEKQARTVDIEASFINSSDIDHLLAGYSADVEIILATSADTLKIPTEALVEGNSVYVFSKEESLVRQIPVSIGLSNWAYVEILSGLQEGQAVVTNVDNPELKDGAAAKQAEVVQ